ncbi:MAG: type VI secretion system needle protein Hcp [Tannerella sp.]|jgi:hypothetical protein|nr:type VI secretion system needle protein Hcp [Tannerella sp.]
MAFLTKLQLADGVYDALDCVYSFHREVDEKGRPSSSVFGGTIKIVVESNDDMNIVEQLMNQFEPISGSVTFHKDGDASPMKELSWENGYVMKFSESFDIRDSEPMKIYFEVFAEKITMAGETIDHKWPK